MEALKEGVVKEKSDKIVGILERPSKRRIRFPFFRPEYYLGSLWNDSRVEEARKAVEGVSLYAKYRYLSREVFSLGDTVTAILVNRSFHGFFLVRLYCKSWQERANRNPHYLAETWLLEAYGLIEAHSDHHAALQLGSAFKVTLKSLHPSLHYFQCLLEGYIDRIDGSTLCSLSLPSYFDRVHCALLTTGADYTTERTFFQPDQNSPLEWLYEALPPGGAAPQMTAKEIRHSQLETMVIEAYEQGNDRLVVAIVNGQDKKKLATPLMTSYRQRSLARQS